MFNYPTGFNSVMISNMALSALGARATVASLNENSNEGITCKLWYDFCRLQTLASYNWSFAKTRVDLVLSDEDPPDTIWDFRYLLPDDCIAIRELQNPLGPSADAVPYSIEKSPLGVRTLVTNLEDAVAVYTSDVTDTEEFTPFFADCLSTYLAYRIAVAITGDEGKRDQMAKQFVMMIRVAPAQDANESVDAPPRDAEAIRARN